MKKKIVWSQDASDDLIEIVTYIKGLYRVFCGYNSRPPQKKSMAVL